METARLRRSSEIAAARIATTVASDGRFAMRVMRNDLPFARAAIAASRGVGTAVRRNRVRRRLREALRADLRGRSGPGLDVFLQARPGALTASSEELRQALRRALDAAFERLG